MLTPSDTPTSGDALRLVFDLETLLIDRAAGVRHALTTVARTHRCAWRSPLTVDDLRSRTLGEVLAEIADCGDHLLINDLVAQYWRVYEHDSRYRAPLLPGAQALIDQIRDAGVELHYLSTWGPQIASRMAHSHGLEPLLTTVYTPQQRVCPCLRARLFACFIASQPHPPDTYLLLSDTVDELACAQRLGVPAIGLGYAQNPSAALEAVDGVIGVAASPAEAAHWIRAQRAYRLCLGLRQRDGTARLH